MLPSARSRGRTRPVTAGRAPCASPLMRGGASFLQAAQLTWPVGARDGRLRIRRHRAAAGRDPASPQLLTTIFRQEYSIPSAVGETHPRDLLRPRLRGWLHAAAAPVSLVAGAVLIAVADGSRTPLAVYTAPLMAMFATSALYHWGRWSASGRTLWKWLDHSIVFFAIAGGYTAFCTIALPPSLATMILGIVWAGRAGAGLQLLWAGAPRWLSAPSTPPWPWSPLVSCPTCCATAAAALTLLCAGGAVPARVAFAARWPDPFPSTFGYHEVSHACTLMAAGCPRPACGCCTPSP